MHPRVNRSSNSNTYLKVNINKDTMPAGSNISSESRKDITLVDRNVPSEPSIVKEYLISKNLTLIANHALHVLK